MNFISDPDPFWFSYASLPVFRKRSCSLCLRFSIVLLSLVFSATIMLSEVLVCICLLIYRDWPYRLLHGEWTSTQSSTLTSLATALPTMSSNPPLPLAVQAVFNRVAGAAGWVVLGSLGLSICVVLWDWIQARSIVESDSIPHAFLNLAAFRLWSIKSYAHFCLLSKITWGENTRQRLMTMIYFGMQGSIAVIVSLPRLVVYGCILYSVSLVPDFGLSADGFQSIDLAGYSSLEEGLLTSVLVAMALSSVVHAFHLLRVTLCGIVCALSVCYIGKLRRTLIKDLESRISVLVASARQRGGSFQQRFDMDSKGNNDLVRASCLELHGSVEQDFAHFQSSEKINSGQEMSSIPHVQEHRVSEDEFHHIDLGPGGSSHDLAHIHASSPYTSKEALPMVNLALADHQAPHPVLSSTAVPAARTNQNQLQQLQPSPSETPFRHSLMPPTSTARSASGPNNRLAALSFYDDLLKSISSERQILNSSMSNYATACDRAQNYRESHNLSIGSPSIALCSSVPLSYSSSSDYDNRSIAERPVHPFDIVAPIELQQPTQFSGPSDANDHLDSRGYNAQRPIHVAEQDGRGLITHLDVQDEQDNHGSGSYLRRDQLARCGSSNSQSQETIENWRIHVAPSSPTTPAIECDLEDQPDENDQDYMMGMDRRGTIPIILSRHLQEVTASRMEYNLFFDAADLHIPRPLYATNQTRTQRQGSVNSSIGGYNYSTAASSPSLADSLSNPMYQQQSLGIVLEGGSTCPRSFPPRKGSLPSSINSSIFDDATVRAGLCGHSHQQAHSHLPLHLTSSTPHRTRTRVPSNLSHVVDMTQDQSHQQQRSRTHMRSLSHGAESSGRLSGSSWDQQGLFDDAQVGYATLINVPTAPVSRLTIQDRDLTRLSNSEMNRMPSVSLQEAMSIDNHQASRDIPAIPPCLSLYEPSNSFEGEIADRFVHPLDLSPLQLQPAMESSRRREYNYQDPHAPHTPQPAAAWENYTNGIGLGLSFGSFQHQGVIDARTTGHYAMSTSRPITAQPSPQWMVNGYESNPQPSFDEMYRIEGDMTTHNLNRLMTQIDIMSPHHRVGSNSGDMQVFDYNDFQQTQQHQDRNEYDYDYDYYDSQQPFDYDSNFPVYYEPQQQQQQQQQTSYQSTALFPLQQQPSFQRQPSLRNKKNLVLNTAVL